MTETQNPTAFSSLASEYDEALEAYKAAQARLDKASSALRSSRCMVHFATAPSNEPGYTTHVHCTLQAGHEGEHANATRKA